MAAEPGGRTARFFLACLLCFSLEEVLRGSLWWLRSGRTGPCQLDNEGSWSIGIFKGPSPFELWPLEQVKPRQDSDAAWPVANPVLRCASVSDSPSNFVADPFLWQHSDGKMYLFHETKTSKTQRGEIGVAVSSDAGITWTHQGIVLREPWHLSYPLVFKHSGEMYMLPEGSLSGKLWLYRATSFPTAWVRDRVLIDRPLIDASLVEYQGRWWLFATDHTRPRAAKNGELEAWHAEDPLGPWQQHARNPLIAADRTGSARSGGRPLVHEGRLYRFAQDCAQTYGHRVVAWEVTKLSPTEYEQQHVPLALHGLGPGQPLKSSWHSARQHHLDVQQLPSGEWIAALDGDRVASGPISSRVIHTALRLLMVWTLAAGLWGIYSSVSARWRGGPSRWVTPHPSPGPLSPTKRRPSAGSNRPGLTAVRSSLEIETRATSSELESRALGLGRLAGTASEVRKKSRPVIDLEWQQKGEPAEAAPPATSSKLPVKRQHSGQSRGRSSRRMWKRIACGLLVPPAALLALFSVTMILYLAPFHAPNHALTVNGQLSQFTLLCMSYDARMVTLQHFVRHYSRCPSVSDIVIAWNKGEPPVVDRDFDSTVPVRVRVEERNTLNNRFRIDPGIHNRAVLSLDDDIMLPCADVERAFAIWRTNPEKMVGFYPRLIEGDPLVFRGEEYAIRRGEYNAVLTGAAFIDTQTAFPLYWADAVAPGRDTVDRVFNGEDLLMNFVLANHSHAGAIEFLPPTRRMDISKFSGVGISHNFNRFKSEAAEYLANFTATFGHVPLQAHPLSWENGKPPFCAIGILGCIYL